MKCLYRLVTEMRVAHQLSWSLHGLRSGLRRWPLQEKFASAGTAVIIAVGIFPILYLRDDCEFYIWKGKCARLGVMGASETRVVSVYSARRLHSVPLHLFSWARAIAGELLGEA